MQDCKREFERLNLPLPVSFRPTYGATDYTDGMMKNISCNGLALEVEKFSFIKYENLQINLKFPQHENVLSLEGSVVWKKQSDSKSMAGIKLKNIEGENKAELIESMSSLGNIPVERTQTGNQDEIQNMGHTEEIQKLSKPKRKKRSSKRVRKTGFTKQYFNGGSKCKVTFRLPFEAASDANQVTIVGDFNDWNTTSIPMKQVKHGDYLVTIELHSNKEYRFKYLIDSQSWENDWYADKYIANEFGSEDSVVII
jgi:hypothetical protein